MTGAQFTAVAALLLAGLPRLASTRRARRPVALAHCAAALAAVAELDPVERWAAHAQVSAWLLGLQSACVTVAAGSVLAVAGWVSPYPLRLSWPPTAAALPVILLQGTLVYSAAQRAPDGVVPLDVLAGADRPELVALWAVTVCAPGVATAVAAPVFWHAWPGLGAGVRLALWGAAVGLGGLALEVVLTGAQLLVPAQVRALPPAAVIGALDPAPFALIAAGLTTAAARLVEPLVPLQRWLAAHLALRQLDGLTRDLLAGAPEWAEGVLTQSWSVHKPAEQLHFRMATIRGASLTLLGYVDDDDVYQALQVARAHRKGRSRQEILGLADACWLRRAIARRRRGVAPVAGEPELIPRRRTRQPETPGPLQEEIAALLAVRRAWHDPVAMQFAGDVDPIAVRHGRRRDQAENRG